MKMVFLIFMASVYLEELSRKDKRGLQTEGRGREKGLVPVKNCFVITFCLYQRIEDKD